MGRVELLTAGRCAGFVWLLWALAFCSSVRASEPADAASGAAAEFFETRIRPLLANHCYECHGPAKQESGLRLDSLQAALDGGELGRAVVPGEPGRSLLILAIRHEEELRMPPERKLSTQQIIDLTQWIQTGAVWPNATGVLRDREAAAGGGQVTEQDRAFWAFQPLAAVTAPSPANGVWARSPLDRFVLSKLEDAGLVPAPETDRRTWIRRATFDLHGVPPTPSETAAFVGDVQPRAYARVVDRLLASPRYGERWGRHWLDVVRYADSNGLDENLCFAHAYRYRDYVIEAFNRDEPYDEFVREQVAGDLMPDEEDEDETIRRHIATAYLALGAKMLACDDGVKMRMDIIDEQLNTLGQSLLGMTLGCARCHDHKFDPIPTADYYALAGIFKSTKTMVNYNVVAKWYERPVAARHVIAAYESHQQRVAAEQALVTASEKEANQAVLAAIRGRAGDYLLAGATYLDRREWLEPIRAGLESNRAQVRAATNQIEGEAFARGNADRLTNGYGEGIGVIATSAAAHVEYDFEIPVAGPFVLAIRYAAAESRPLELLVNGKQLGDHLAGNVTGGWYPPHQQWHCEEILELPAGTSTIRLQRELPFPHIDKVALISAAAIAPEGGEAVPNGRSQPDLGGLIQPAIVAWADAVAASREDPDSILSAWHEFAAANPVDAASAGGAAGASPQLARWFGSASPSSRAELAALYQQLFDRVVRAVDDAAATAASDVDAAKEDAPPRDVAGPTLDDPAAEAARKLLYGEGSPVRLPPDPRQYDAPRVADQIAAARRRLDDLAANAPPAPEQAMGVTEGPEIGDMPIHHRGNYLTPGQTVRRGFLQVLEAERPPPIAADQSGRLQLANWLTAPRTPASALLARVMVNRIWRWHFGVGIVPSTDNFGRLGDSPSNPALLEYLSDRFVQSGWSLKAMHREIMLSSAYRMSTAYDAESAAADPENRLLWRMNRRRLEAEAVRDSLLAVAGELDGTMGGTVLKVGNREYVTVSGTRITDEFDQPRRSIYLPVVRSAMYDALATFDFPDPAVPNGSRPTTTIAPQALFMTNSQLVHDQMGRLAEKLLSRYRHDPGRVAGLYELLYSREPNANEVDRALQFLDNYEQQDPRSSESELATRRQRAWQALCRVLVSTNEFIYVE